MISENKASVTKNVLVTSVGKYAEYFLALISSIIVARGLGADSYGLYTYIIFVCGWLIALSNISLPTTAIRFVAESRGKEDLEEGSHIAGMLLSRQTVNSIVVCTVFFLAMQFYQPEILRGQGNYLFLLVCIAVFLKARYTFLVSVAKGHEKFDVEAYTATAVGLVGIIFMAFLAATGAAVESFFLAFALTCGMMMVMASWMNRRKDIRYTRDSIEPGQLSRITQYRRITTLLGLVALFEGRTLELFILGQYGTSVEVGYLGLSNALTRGLTDLSTVGLTMVLMPSLARAFGSRNLDAVKRIFLEATRYYVFFGVGLGFVGIILAEPLVRILYGSEFQDAAWVLASLLAISGCALAGAAIGAFLSTTDRQDLRLKFSITVVVVHFIVALWLVPRYGLPGAVYSSAVSSLFSLILGFQWVARNLGMSIPFSLYLRVFLAGAVAFGLAYTAVLLTESVILQLGSACAFIVFYGYLSIVLKCWQRGDLDILKYCVGLLPAGINLPLLRVIARFDR